MNIAAQKMEQVREVFQAAKSFCSMERNLQKIIAFCENAQPEFTSIAYEAASMQIGLRDFDENNSLKSWKHFADDLAKPHAAQVYAGLGWAVAQQTLPLETIIETLPELLKYRVADGCGYYDGTFRNRQTVRNKQLPIYISGKNLQPYFQGVGRSLWYISKADVAKTNELLLSFDEKYNADMWRGVGIAVAYVGGCDEATWTELKNYAHNYLPQFTCGIALGVRSRVMAKIITDEAELCAVFFFRRSAQQVTQRTIDAECGDYFRWLKEIEE